MFSATRNIGFFRNGAQSGDWAGSSFTCGRTKTEGFEYDVFKVYYCNFIVSAFSSQKRFKAIKVINGYERTRFFCFVLFWGGGGGGEKDAKISRWIVSSKSYDARSGGNKQTHCSLR